MTVVSFWVTLGWLFGILGRLRRLVCILFVYSGDSVYSFVYWKISSREYTLNHLWFDELFIFFLQDFYFFNLIFYDIYWFFLFLRNPQNMSKCKKNINYDESLIAKVLQRNKYSKLVLFSEKECNFFSTFTKIKLPIFLHLVFFFKFFRHVFAIHFFLK